MLTKPSKTLRPLIFGIMVSVLAAPAFAANEFKYDPSACNKDTHNNLYIALGEYVFAVPWGGDVMVNPVFPNDHRIAPHPDEPIGCLGNPAQMRSYSFLYEIQATHDAKAGIANPPNPSPDLLQLIVQTPFYAPLMDGFELRVADSICKAATVHEVLPNGLIACRIKSEKPQTDDWIASYKAPPELYTTPQGGIFAIDCDGGTHSSYMGKCSVAYMIKPFLLISYRFRPFLGPRAIAFDKIIEFDRNLRSKVNAMMIGDYVWPQQENHFDNTKTEGSK